jgi:membrane-bound metal-dependent hydrolase YbcI (DUF457 family)
MNYPYHLAAGAIAGLSAPIIMKEIGISIPEQQQLAIFPAILLGSIFPDIDTESIPSKIYAAFSLFCLIIFAIKNKPWHGVILMIPYLAAKISRHRGFTHSFKLVISLILIPLVVTLLAIIFPSIDWLANLLLDYYITICCFAAGIVIHKILDMKIFKRFGK